MFSVKLRINKGGWPWESSSMYAIAGSPEPC